MSLTPSKDALKSALQRTCLNMMERIEDKTKTMVHEIEYLKDPVQRYYSDDCAKPMQLLQVLNRYWDSLNMDGVEL